MFGRDNMVVCGRCTRRKTATQRAEPSRSRNVRKRHGSSWLTALSREGNEADTETGRDTEKNRDREQGIQRDRYRERCRAIRKCTEASGRVGEGILLSQWKTTITEVNKGDRISPAVTESSLSCFR